MDFIPCFRVSHFIPLVSVTRDGTTDDVYRHPGFIEIEEVVVQSMKDYLAAAIAKNFVLDFFGHPLINIKPNIKSSFTSTNYHLVQQWFTESRRKIKDQLLKNFPAVCIDLGNGAFDRVPTEEEELEMHRILYHTLEFNDSELRSNTEERA